MESRANESSVQQPTEQLVNGVPVERLQATVAAVQANPELAKFQFRARNRWLSGGHNRTRVQDFYGAGMEDTSRPFPFYMDAAEPAVLLGEDQGPNPVEYVLAALAGCLTTSLVYHAAARGIVLNSVECLLEGELDLRGFLNLADDVRRGYQWVQVEFDIRSDAPREVLEDLVQLARRQSPVADVVSNPVTVRVSLAAPSDGEAIGERPANRNPVVLAPPG
jgi:uncharacterized OsmC-like protein